jgi:hypothetical protein
MTISVQQPAHDRMIAQLLSGRFFKKMGIR